MASRKKKIVHTPKRFYGWKKGPERPKPFKFVRPHNLLGIPSQVDLESGCPEVYNQEDLGSCTAQAAGALAQFLMKKLDLPDWIPSRLALYWWNRLQIDTINEDSGASLQDAMNTLVKFGVPNESLWPYDVSKFKIKPDKPVWSDGYWHSVKTGLAVEQNLDDIKACLAAGYPIIFGFAVFESFETKEVATTGIMPMPKDGEKLLGGHAVMAVGYDDTTKMVKVRNSWGKNWGKNGYFYMPYEFITDPRLCDDFWTAHEYIRFKK